MSDLRDNHPEYFNPDAVVEVTGLSDDTIQKLREGWDNVCVGFVKSDRGKPRYSLIPPIAELEMVEVLTFGALKYSADNWKQCKDLSRYVDAALRHIAAYRSGEQIDTETGRHHLAHAMCCLSFIIDIELGGRTMTHGRLKRGVLHTFMWAIAYQLDQQFPNRPTRKLKGIALQVWNSYTQHERDILNLLKNRAWERIEDRFEGQVNMPFLLTHLYWSFPDLFGPRVRQWIDAMDDEIIAHLDDEMLEVSNEITEWYAEMVDKVVFNYLKEEKRSVA